MLIGSNPQLAIYGHLSALKIVNDVISHKHYRAKTSQGTSQGILKIPSSSKLIPTNYLLRSLTSANFPNPPKLQILIDLVTRTSQYKQHHQQVQH